MTRIESESLRVDIDPTGAELTSLFYIPNGTEFLWQGDPKTWARCAPVLFPIVGRLKDGAYTHKGKEYKMPAHGFAGDASFDVVEKTDNSAIFELKHSAETLAMYPFEFAFRVGFEVSGNTLNTTYYVQNKNNDDMCFSVGSHESYRCPISPDEGEVFEDYYLEFGQKDKLSCHKLSPNGLLTGEFFDVAFDKMEGKHVLPLRYDVFEKNDSLVFENLSDKQIFLKSKKSNAYLEIGLGDATNLVLWTTPGKSYICIEAWNGLPDYESQDSRELRDKKGVVRVKPGETLQYSHSVTIHKRK